MAIDFANAGKKIYSKEKVENLVYKDRPFFSMINKDKEMGGESTTIAVVSGNSQGRSATLSTAITNKQGGTINKFVITEVQNFSVADIDMKDVEKFRNNNYAMLDYYKTVGDLALDQLALDVSNNMFLDKTGNLAQVSVEPTENATTFNIALKVPSDVVRFEINQYINIYSTETGTTKRTSDGSDDEWKITAINRSTGTLTVSGTYDASGTIAADDYIVIEGDRNLKISGLKAWVPYTAPTSGDSFFGLDRSEDPVRLAGARYDGSSDSKEEAVKRGCLEANINGGNVDVVFMNPLDYLALENELGVKVQYINSKGYGTIGFEGIKIQTSKGIATVVADNACPQNYAYCLTLNTWKLHSIQEPIKLQNADGNTTLRSSTANSAELRFRFYGQMSCKGPGFNCVVKLA